MHTIVNLYSPKKGEISRFLNSYYNKEVNIENDLKCIYSFINENIEDRKKKYPNQKEMIDYYENLIKI